MALYQDLQFSVRSLRRQPGLVLTAFAVLTLGIGVNIALFTAVKAVLFDPLPYRDPERLVILNQRNNGGPAPLSPPDFFDWQRDSHSFTQMAGYGWTGGNLSGDSAKLPERIQGLYVSYNFFSTLGVHPALGRAFHASDDRIGAARTIVLSNSLWRSRYGADPHIIGKTLNLDADLYTIIGVMPEQFTFAGSKNQFWIPLHLGLSPQALTQRGVHCMSAVGRLKSGVSMQQAQAELSSIQARLQQQYGYNFGDSAASVTSLLDEIVGKKTERSLYVLWAAGACILLIACVNVTNLLSTRSTSRRREMAIRTALGATRRQITWLLLLESLLLSCAGGAAGMLLASWLVALLSNISDKLPRSSGIEMDGMAVLFAAAITLLSGIAAGLAPALSASQVDLNQAMHESGRTSSGSRQRQQFRNTLVAVEIALSFFLLVSGGLLLKSFVLLRNVDTGFHAQHVLTMSFSLSSKYRTPAQITNFYEQLLQRIRVLPGVQSAGLVSVLPLQGHVMDTLFEISGRPPLQYGQVNDAVVRFASPDYFRTLGIPLVKGRYFTASERLEKADKAIVSESFARRYFPHENPLGQHITFMGKTPKEIVGVVGDVRQYLNLAPEPIMYAPILSGDLSFASIVIRSVYGDPLALALPVQKQIAQLDPDLPVANVLTLNQLIDVHTATQKFNMTLLLSFAGLALLLATVGLYGVISYATAQRTSEFGIRMALGATPEDLMRSVLLQGVAPAMIGVVIGFLGACFIVRAMRSMLFEVQPFDPTVYVAVAVGLLGVSLLACAIPARRTARIDPAQVLRAE